MWIPAPNYDLGSKEFEYIWKVFKEKLPSRGIHFNFLPGTSFNPKRGDFAIFLGSPYFSWLKVKSAENLDSFLGEALDDLILAEAPKMPAAAWSHYLTDRIVTKLGNVILPATPDGFNWAYDEFFLPANGLEAIGLEASGNSSEGDFWTQSTSAEECPDAYYPAQEKRRMLDRIAKDPEDKHRIEQFHGRFTHMSGLVLYQLGEKNLVSASSLPRAWGWAS